MAKSTKTPIEILSVESNFENIHFIEQLLDKTKFQYKLHVSNSISNAIDFLSKNENCKNKHVPDIILFHSEPTNDYEKGIFKEIETNKSFSHIPLLFLKFKGNKIEISKAINKQFKYSSKKEMDIEYFIETIVSLKKFMGSLYQDGKEN